MLDKELPAPLQRIVPPLLDDLRTTLGADLVGIYLYGSAVSGGFDPALSDLDLLIVTEAPIETIEFARLAGVVDRLKERELDWADRLDLTFIGRERLGRFHDGGPVVYISHEESLNIDADASDWERTWFLVRNADCALAGPSAASLIPPMDFHEFLHVVALDVDHFAAAARDEARSGSVAYRLLTLCRLLRSLDSGAQCTKQEGAEWTAARFPDWAAAIQTALDVRASAGVREFSSEERADVMRLLDELAEQIRTTGPSQLPN